MASFSKIKCQRLYVGSSSGIASELTSTQTGFLSGVTAGTATASNYHSDCYHRSCYWYFEHGR
jgi:hypothetical protein